MTGDHSHRDTKPTGDFSTETRHCEVCEEATRHAVEEQKSAGVTSLLYTCEQCRTMSLEPKRKAFVIHLDTDVRRSPSTAGISFHRSA